MVSQIAKISTSWWRHQMENCPRYWPFVRGIHRSPVNSPHKGQWRGALMFSLICTWINSWVKIVRLVIWDAIAPIMTSVQWYRFDTYAIDGYLIHVDPRVFAICRVGASTQVLSTSTSTLLSMSTSTEKMCEYEFEYFSLSTSTSYPKY